MPKADTKVGKTIGGALYVHRSAIDWLDPAHVGLTMEKPAALVEVAGEWVINGDVLNIDNSADTTDTQAVLTETSLAGLGMGDLGEPGTTFNEVQTLR